jgi:NADP-dependent 3-hydroxy acid dehydrogenase YdfG
MRVKGLVIYVSGACSGLGEATAADLVKSGAFVVALCVIAML